MKRLYRKVRHNWCYRKGNFLKTRVYKTTDEDIVDERDLWSYFQLGMYDTVTKLTPDKFGWKGYMALIVSYAATGKHAKAAAYLKELKACKKCQGHLVKISKALAPFMPEASLKLLDQAAKKPNIFYCALLIRAGHKEKAFKILTEQIASKSSRQEPEAYLYATNVSNDLSNAKMLRNLNTFLVFNGVPKVRLKDKQLPPSVLNITCKQELNKEKSPLVSILMTTYQTGHRADVAIESLLNQTYQNIELIVVDDASNDDTTDIIKEWVKKDKRVRLIELSQNVGTYVAKNIALLEAKGEFVTCHDSDDWSHPLKIERQAMPLVKNRRLMATISSWIRIDDNGKYYTRSVYPLLRQNPSSLMFRREKTLAKAGIWDCVRTGADSEFIARLKLVFGRKKVKRIKEPLSFGAHRSDSLMNASSTGYCEFGMSPQRLEYWESWNKWHIEELRKGKKPFIAPDLLAPRKFEAPDSIVLEKDSINSAWNSAK